MTLTLSGAAAAVQAAEAAFTAAEATLAGAPDADVKAAMAAIIEGDGQPDGTVDAARAAVEAARVQLMAARMVYEQAQ